MHFEGRFYDFNTNQASKFKSELLENFDYYHPLAILNEKYKLARLRCVEGISDTSSAKFDLEFLKSSLLNLSFNDTNFLKFYSSIFIKILLIMILQIHY